jgi:hypothetical protein
MSETTIHDAPDRSLGAPTDDAWRRDQRAFAAMLPSLLEAHRDQYVAVHDGKPIASGPELVEVALAAYRRVGYVPVYVDLVSDRPREPARMPSPRLPRNRPSVWRKVRVIKSWSSPPSAEGTTADDEGASAG